jgi:acetyl esterase/lipase
LGKIPERTLPLYWRPSDRAGVIGTALIGGFFDLAAIPTLASGPPGDFIARASPINNIGSAMPPVLVVHGGADTDAPVEQARRYCDAVGGHPGRCRFVEVAGASHRSENWWPSQWDYKRELTTWLSGLASGASTLSQFQSGVVQKDIVFAPATQLKLDAFVPPSHAPVPAVLMVHGGGWEAATKSPTSHRFSSRLRAPGSHGSRSTTGSRQT